MGNRSIAVLVNREAARYQDYVQLIKPYLDHFGFPYSEIENGEVSDCALVLIGHAGVACSNSALRAVEAGAGLVCFDSDALPESWCEPASCGKANTVFFAPVAHYVTALHEANESRPLYDAMQVCGSVLKDSETLATADGMPLMQVSEAHGGKVVLWRSLEWASHRVLGPIHGMDDLFWRGIVWAAKKPFVMQGMPPFVGMRIDDVWGAHREINPESPLSWVETAMSFGIKPWLGVFQDNTNEATVQKIREYVHSGKASAFPHAFAGCDWVPSDLPEHWAHFDHRAKKPWSDDVMAANAARIKAWYKEQDIPIAKYALAHYYEMGANAVKYLPEYGCEFIGIHMQPDTPYGIGPWLKAGPYRKFEDGVISASRPVYYEDYLTVDHAPELSGKLFNCVAEIRDVSGYEWHPLYNTKITIERGIKHLRREFDSMVTGVLFTHESCWIQRLSTKVWKDSLTAILGAVAHYKPFFWTMDEICGYARAKHDVCFADAQATESGVALHITGKNDRATMCYLFTDSESGIEQRLVDIPQINAETDVSVQA